MPQLNPAPWFMIMVFSWAVVLVYLPPKVLKHFFLKAPVLKPSLGSKVPVWSWPWF